MSAGERLPNRRARCRAKIVPFPLAHQRPLVAKLAARMILTPLMASSQEAGRPYPLGFLFPIGREAPAVVAFFDELGLAGFVEGKNLTVVPGGFDVPGDQIAERVIGDTPVALAARRQEAG
jgi:hypothetical protein